VDTRNCLSQIHINAEKYDRHLGFFCHLLTFYPVITQTFYPEKQYIMY